MPLEPTSPDPLVFVAGLRAWIAVSIIASRYNAATPTAKIAPWLVLPVLVFLWFVVLCAMRVP